MITHPSSQKNYGKLSANISNKLRFVNPNTVQPSLDSMEATIIEVPQAPIMQNEFEFETLHKKYKDFPVLCLVNPDKHAFTS